MLLSNVSYSQCVDKGTDADGDFIATHDTTLAGGIYNFHNFTVLQNVKVEVTGNNPLLIHASGKVTIEGELNASGKNGTDGIGYSQGGAEVAGGANGGSDGSTSCGSGGGGSGGFIQLVTHHLDTLGTLSVDGGIGGSTVLSSFYHSRGGNGSKGRIIAKKSMQSSELIQLDIVNEPSGVYFIKITKQN